MVVRTAIDHTPESGILRTNPGPWAVQSGCLKFSLFGRHLHTVSFDALGAATADGWPEFRNATTPPPLDALGQACRAVFIDGLPIPAPLPRLSFESGAIRYAPSQYRRYYVELQGSVDEYLKKIGRHERHVMRGRIKKFNALAGEGNHLRSFRTPEQMREFLTLAHQVSLKTYQHRLFDEGLLATPANQRELEERAASDRVRAFALVHEDTPLAFHLLYASGDVIRSQKTGYDPAHASFGPGILLLYLLLQELFAERRFRICDFGPGEYEYKKRLATASVFCADVYYFRSTFANLFLVHSHTAADFINLSLKAILRSFGLEDGVRRFVRRRHECEAGSQKLN